MISTAGHLAELFSKMNSTDKVWYYFYTKDEIEVHNSPEPDGHISESDWVEILSTMERRDERAIDDLQETFNEAVGDNLVDIRCRECYEFDYTTIEVNEERVCKDCGEEKDGLDVQTISLCPRL